MQTVNDKLFSSLRRYSGSLNDKLYSSLKEFGYSGALPDMIHRSGFGNISEMADNIRAFRTNGGDGDSIDLSSPVVLGGDFSVKWEGEVPADGGYVFIKTDGSPASRMWWSSNGRLALALYTGAQSAVNVASAIVGDGKLHRFSLDRSNDDITITVDDDAPVFIMTNNADLIFDRLLHKGDYATSVVGFSGVIYNFQVYSNEILIHSWTMGEGVGTIHYDSVGGNNGTIVDGEEGDWEIYIRYKDSNEWTGATPGAVLEIARPPQLTSIMTFDGLNVVTSDGYFVKIYDN